MSCDECYGCWGAANCHCSCHERSQLGAKTEPKKTECGFCDKGKTEWRRMFFDGTPDDRTVIDCPYCDGTGWVVDQNAVDKPTKKGVR